MIHVLVRHKVMEYSKWKEVFDEHANLRKMAGSKGGRLFRNEKNSNDVAILLEWDDMTRARKFFEAEDLNRVMERAGVLDKPDIFFEVEKVAV